MMKKETVLCIAIANKQDCLLIGEDSDYFIPALPKGYAPFQFLDCGFRNGDPVTCRVYYHDFIAQKFGIPPELMIAIPALTGNDTIPNLIEETRKTSRPRAAYIQRQISK